MRAHRGLFAAPLAILVALGCRAGDDSGISDQPSEVPVAASGAARTPAKVTVLADSVAPLRRFFNGAQGRRRFVAVLSPSCPVNLQGARAVRHAVVDAPSTQPWAIAIVWIQIRPTDDLSAVHRARRELSDPRIRHFYDPARLAGRAVARATWPQFGKPAWGVYLFFDTSARWQGPDPPAPTDKLGQFRGPDGVPLIAAELDARNRPVPLGPASMLERFLTEGVNMLEARLGK